MMARSMQMSFSAGACASEAQQRHWMSWFLGLCALQCWSSLHKGAQCEGDPKKSACRCQMTSSGLTLVWFKYACEVLMREIRSMQQQLVQQLQSVPS